MIEFNIGDEIAKVVVRRAYRLDFETVYKLLDNKPFILAGGSLCGDPVNDFDLYPDSTNPYSMAAVRESIDAHRDKVKFLSSTRNAITVKLVDEDQVVQFCSYRKPTLFDLVKSFDFSHIQVGIRFTGDGEPPHADAEYHTQEFVLANVARRTAYTGSEYPLSSLVRLFKYAKRDKLTRVGVAQAAMKIMKDILVRGYENYDDFKSQLDAVDLSVPELREAWELYRTCCDKGLVVNVRKEN